MIDHQEMVTVLAKDGGQIQSELKASDCHNLHMCMGAAGELGEVIDLVKKSIFYRKEIDRKALIEELGDVEFYLEGLRQGFGITRETVIAGNINKLGERYAGFQYSDQAAKQRADKE